MSGTPLIMLEEGLAASDRLNQNRNKPLHFDCKCYFVDKNEAHTDHLRQALDERGYDTGGDQIVIRNGRFEDELEAILKEIQRRQPRAGRAIFLLDQTGFSQVALRLVSRIFAELAAAEVILTFAADALINHLADVPQFTKAVAPLEITESQVKELMQQRSGNGGRALVQRTLRDQIRNGAGATYDTPFFIRPQKSRRALWFLHLSRHPKARDVMVQRHWEVLNTFEHYGPGDFGILGWDALKDPSQLPLFNFGSLEEEQMKERLLSSLPKRLFSLTSAGPVTLDAVRHSLANETAARFSDLDDVVIQLVGEREFIILSPDGKPRSRNLRNLQPTDRIALPPTSLFPEFSRIG